MVCDRYRLRIGRDTFVDVLILDQPERCGEWARARIAHVDSWGLFQAIGQERGGELVAVAIFNSFTGADIWIHLAIDGRISKQWLYAIFAYPFLDQRVRHLTAFVPARNERAQALCVNAGFKLEGRLREAWPDDDVVLLGMVKAECRFI